MPWQAQAAMDERESFVADDLPEMWTMTELCLALEEVDDALWRVWSIVTPLGHCDERRWRCGNTGHSLDEL